MLSAKELLLSDAGYSAWCNQCLLDACSGLPAEERERDLRISHANVLCTLRHICDGEKVWLDCLRSTAEGETWRLPQGPVPEPSFAALQQDWPALWDGYRGWLEGIGDESLAAEVIVQLPDKAPRLPRWKILRHVFEHSTLHRGQIVGMIRMLGHAPPGIHFMDYCLANEPVIPPRPRA
jgi:uncharacterized damage-inducible protein DinB